MTTLTTARDGPIPLKKIFDIKKDFHGRGEYIHTKDALALLNELDNS